MIRYKLQTSAFLFRDCFTVNLKILMHYLSLADSVPRNVYSIKIVYYATSERGKRLQTDGSNRRVLIRYLTALVAYYIFRYECVENLNVCSDHQINTEQIDIKSALKNFISHTSAKKFIFSSSCEFLGFVIISVIIRRFWFPKQVP